MYHICFSQLEGRLGGESHCDAFPRHGFERDDHTFILRCGRRRERQAEVGVKVLIVPTTAVPFHGLDSNCCSFG